MPVSYHPCAVFVSRWGSRRLMDWLVVAAIQDSPLQARDNVNRHGKRWTVAQLPGTRCAESFLWISDRSVSSSRPPSLRASARVSSSRAESSSQFICRCESRGMSLRKTDRERIHVFIVFNSRKAPAILRCVSLSRGTMPWSSCHLNSE